MTQAVIDSADNPLFAEVVVVGGGPAGLTAAVALAARGVQVILVAPDWQRDNRTTALLDGSVAALDALGVWDEAAVHAAPLETIRLVDDLGGLMRAPQVEFHAGEIGLAAFGYNIANADLVASLSARAAALPALHRIDAVVSGFAAEADEAVLHLADGRHLRCRLVVAADGRNSFCRRAAGITADRHDYPQVAVTANLAHRRPHRQVSTEFHTEGGPFTLVPLPGNASSLVWVTSPRAAERLATLDDAGFAAAVERKARSFLGAMELRSGRGAFPLSFLTARSLTAPRLALVGEAAHVVPPIGAQGFNLGLRDATAIAELAAEACRDGADPGTENVLSRYAERRLPDVRSRTLAVDLLNRSLLTDFLPVQALRGIGLGLIARVGPLRRLLMREGVAPHLGASPLMRLLP